MPKLYTFQKLYGDLVTDDGTAVIVYIAWLHLLGIPFKMAAVTIYRPDGLRERYRATHSYEPSDFTKPREPLQLELQLPDGTFSIRYVDFLPGDSDQIALEEKLSYRCVLSCGRATARLVKDNGARSFHGMGYMDYVELYRPARTLGLKRLEWGRMHFPERTVLYTSLELEKEGPLRLLSVTRKDRQTGRSDRFSLSWDQMRECFELRSELMPDETIRLHPVRILHRGAAIDKRLFPGILERGLFRFITGPAAETRWLSRAEMNGRSPRAESGWALHEQVAFGEYRQASDRQNRNIGRIRHVDHLTS